MNDIILIIEQLLELVLCFNVGLSVIFPSIVENIQTIINKKVSINLTSECL